jgi:enamine deaminase RidA (YjgF/YER057c/UK114 family)
VAGAEVRRLAGDPPSLYEERYGYSRVVVAGPLVLVGGTTSVGECGAVIGSTPYEQASEILGRILHELSRGGATVDDVIQARAYVTDISRAEDVARAFGEVFVHGRPIFTMVEVSALIDPRMLVEIEAVAYVGAP